MTLGIRSNSLGEQLDLQLAMSGLKLSAAARDRHHSSITDKTPSSRLTSSLP